MRRLLHQLRGWLAPPRLAVVYDPRYRRSLPGVPSDPARGEQILAFLVDRGLVRPRDVHGPVRTTLRDVLRAHTPEYLESLQDPATLTAIFGVPIGDAEAGALLELARLEAGGTVQATRLALARPCPAVHLGGGFHHAAPSRGAGFCVINDVAVAIRRLRAKGFRRTVLVVDLDLHHGNGTRAAFADDHTVHTYSIHNAEWDDVPAVASTDIALGSGVTDAAYLDALRETLPPVVAAIRPGLVVYVAGTDPAAGDALGDWRVSPGGLVNRDRFVVEQVRPAPLAIVLGGGYGFAAWRHSARFLSWLAGGRVLEPPDDMELALRRLRPAAGQLTERALTARRSSEWSLSEEDIVGALSGPPRETRVLGHYSAHGLELLLERTGVLDRLRAAGYPAPVLTVDFGDGVTQTVRVFGAADQQHLLIELRVSRNRRLVPGCELLFVEWLLMQDPRAAFTAHSPKLPGQQHPGLGMLGLMSATLVLMAEQAGLDGIANVPSQYYLAVLSRHHGRFIEPAAQARFNALFGALRGLSLPEAERALAEGRVRDGAGTAERWEPAATGIPVTDRFRSRIEGPAFETAVRDAAARFRFELSG